jgi:pimeloyl-ACP methyl ester carboxylesterase
MHIQNESSSSLNELSQLNSESIEFSESFVTLNGSRLHYVSGGSGKLVLFYHGFPSYWYSWKHQLTALAKDYHVVAVDGLGANLSDKPTSTAAYDISTLARQLQQLAHALNGGETFILVGHDWGGALAWAYAQQYPQDLDKLIVLSAPPYNLFLELLQSNSAQQQASTYIERLKKFGNEKTLGVDEANLMWSVGYRELLERKQLSPTDGEHFKKALAQPGALEGGIKWYQANIPATSKITEEDFWPTRTAATPVKSLLIWGGEDKTFVPAFLEQLPEYASQLHIEVLPGIGHWPSLEAPEAVNQLIQNFIASEDYPIASLEL